MELIVQTSNCDSIKTIDDYLYSNVFNFRMHYHKDPRQQIYNKTIGICILYYYKI